jgi:hypothetical protein
MSNESTTAKGNKMRSEKQRQNDNRMKTKKTAAQSVTMNELLAKFAGFPECQKMIRKLA